jgi:hypothetical protein
MQLCSIYLAFPAIIRDKGVAMRLDSSRALPPPVGRLGTSYFLLALTQAAHSMEEMATHLYDFMWTMTGVIHSRFASFPQFRMEADTFAVLNMGFIALLLGTVPYVRARKSWALFLAGVAGVIEVLNGINHLSAAVFFGRYVPGAITAPFLLVLGILMLRELRCAGAMRAP